MKTHEAKDHEQILSADPNFKKINLNLLYPAVIWSLFHLSKRFPPEVNAKTEIIPNNEKCHENSQLTQRLISQT